MNIHYYKSHLKRHGVLKTVFRLFSQSVNKLFTLKFRYLIKFDLKALNSKYLSVDDSFRITRLEPAWLSRHVELEEYHRKKETFRIRGKCCKKTTLKKVNAILKSPAILDWKIS